MIEKSRLMMLASCAALCVAGCATTPDVAVDTSVRPPTPMRGVARTNSRMGERSGMIWQDGGWCQPLSDSEMRRDIAMVREGESEKERSLRLAGDEEVQLARAARDAVDTCAGALFNRVSERLDGRGNLAGISSFGAIGAIASSAASPVTTNVWLAVGTLPVFYEDLQSGRMTAIEYFSGYGMSWIVEQHDALDGGFSVLQQRRNALHDAITTVSGAETRLLTILDGIPVAPAAASATGATPATTRAELERILRELQTARSKARTVLYDADAALALRPQLDEWVAGRFARVRTIAMGQQITSRVGPSEAFRTLLAAPFGVVAETIRGRSGKDISTLVAQQNIQLQYATLPDDLGVEKSNVEIVDFTINAAQIQATSRPGISAETAHVQDMLDRARAARDAITALQTIDDAVAPTLSLPTGS